MKFGPTYLQHFENDILIRCPHCESRAHLLKVTDDSGRRLGYRMVCNSCAHVSEWLLGARQSIPLPSMGPRLSGFGLDLWLQVPCCGETLWAFNEPHLDFMEQFISATLRERSRRDWGWARNSCLESCLPRWMQAAKNRGAVVKSIQSLRDMLVRTDQ